MMNQNNYDLTIKEIRFSRWLLEKRKFFKRLLVFILIVIDLILWGFVFYQVSLLLIYQKNHQENLKTLSKNLVNFENYHKLVEPKPLSVGQPLVIYLGPDLNEPTKSRYDFIVEIENPNEMWFVQSLEGEFTFDNNSIKGVLTSLSPFEKKYLYILNQPIEEKIQNVNFEIKNIKWLRLRPFLKNKLEILKQLSIEKIEFIPTTFIENKIIPARIKFEIKNNSAYSFWDLKLQIAIYKDSKIVDFNIFSIKYWFINQTKSLEIPLSKHLDNISKIVIIPDLDFLNENLFIKP
jgi:hypothetical protein